MARIPVRITVRPGVTAPAPQDLPYWIEIEPSDSPAKPEEPPKEPPKPPEWELPPIPIWPLARLLTQEPSDLPLEPGSTLVVQVTAADLERLGELERFVTSDYLAELGVEIEVVVTEDDNGAE